MPPKKLSQSVLKKIKKEKIKPRPKWHFLIKNSLFWAIFGMAALLGAKAIGIIIFILTEANFLLIWQSRGPHFSILLRIFPFFWIIFLLLFLFLASEGLHHTEKGYKIPLPKLIGINILISLILGVASYGLGYAEKFEHFFGQRAPFYAGFRQEHTQIWSNPGEGRLAGTIIEIQNNQILLLDDFNQKRWTVDYQASQTRGPVTLEVNEKIRLVGEVVDENEFKATIISPWEKTKPFGRFREPKPELPLILPPKK